jgi:hypothetical protein
MSGDFSDDRSEERIETSDLVEADLVEEADSDSFPASDPPAPTAVVGIPDRPLDPNAYDKPARFYALSLGVSCTGMNGTSIGTRRA